MVNYRIATLVDFLDEFYDQLGIAKASQTLESTALLTAAGTTVGTPNYIAPEQAMAGSVGGGARRALRSGRTLLPSDRRSPRSDRRFLRSGRRASRAWSRSPPC